MDKSYDKGQLYRFGVAFLLILAFFIAVQTVKIVKEYRYVGYDASSRNTITVRGEGEAFAIPDTAVFSFSVVESAATVAEAQRKATEKLNTVLDVFEAEGIEDRDIKTVGYNAYPKYEYPDRGVACGPYGCPPSGNPTIVGYEVSHTVEVKVRESSKAGDLMGKVGAQNVSNVSGLDFRVDDMSMVQAEARGEAIADAREKAEAMAQALDVDLVRVVNFYENASGVPYYAYGRGSAMDMASSVKEVAPIPVQPGESQVNSSVEIVYEIR